MLNRKLVLVVAMVALSLVTSVEARGRWFGRGYSISYQLSIPAGCHTRTAQGVAEIMARLLRVGHWGGNSSYEGCASGSSQAQAYASCCYANAGLTTVDVGYAQSASGQWFCCRRYR